MAQQLNPYVTFPGNAEEALNFYARILGGTPRLMTFRESGMDADGIMHGSLDTPAGFHIFASDTMEGMSELKQGNNMQMSLSGDESSALRGYWEGLAEGGNVVVPLEKQMWGDEYGQLIDRYGITWHVNIAG
ncbi:VOC family protein [Granulicoccus sp. GXG6511]|uniref:VOC family protein n=1 Tax=Granulicoccus sp. GXG6511 TaxID=3381351 RepID=UPI003D7D6814